MSADSAKAPGTLPTLDRVRMAMLRFKWATHDLTKAVCAVTEALETYRAAEMEGDEWKAGTDHDLSGDSWRGED